MANHAKVDDEEVMPRNCRLTDCTDLKMSFNSGHSRKISNRYAAITEEEDQPTVIEEEDRLYDTASLPDQIND